MVINMKIIVENNNLILIRHTRSFKIVRYTWGLFSQLMRVHHRKRKKVMKEKRKLRDKMSLDMISPGDTLGITDDPDLFNLTRLKKVAED